ARGAPGGAGDIVGANGGAGRGAGVVAFAGGAGLCVAGAVGVAVLAAQCAVRAGIRFPLPGGGVEHPAGGTGGVRLGGRGDGEAEGKRQRNQFEAMSKGAVHDVLLEVGRNPVAPLPVVAGFNAGPSNHENAEWELTPGPRAGSARLEMHAALQSGHLTFGMEADLELAVLAPQPQGALDAARV